MSGHVVKREKSWSVVLELGKDENGKRKTKWRGGYPTKREALKALTKYNHELNTGTYIEETDMTTGAWLDEWLAKWSPHLKPYTRRGREFVVTQIKAEIGNVPLRKLSAQHIQGMVNKFQTVGSNANRGPLAASTIGKHMTCLSAAMNKAADLELIRRNPCRAVVRPRIEREELSVLESDEVQRLLRESRQEPFFMQVLLAITTGMRRGEITALRWQDVDLEQGALLVRRNAVQLAKGEVVFNETKTSKPRVIALPAFVVAELRKHRTIQKEQRLAAGNRWQDGDLVSCTPLGGVLKPEWLSERFGYFAKAHNFPVTFHGLRHSHASLLLAQGVHMKVVQERLGHSKIGQTMDLYVHTCKGMQEDAARGLESLAQ
jgi:integrase